MRPDIPVFAEADVSSARAVAFEVAGRLRERDRLRQALVRVPRQTSFPEAHRWHACSLAMGDAGLALMCAAFDRAAPDEGWDSTGHTFLSRAVVDVGAGRPLSLFHGVTGIAAAAWALSHSGRRYGNLLARLDSLLLPSFINTAERVRATGRSPFRDGHDLLNGLAGWAVYLLGRGSGPAVDSALNSVVGALVRLMTDEDGAATFLTEPEHVRDADRADFPRGYVNCGLAHGIPGPLAALSLVRLAGRVEGCVVDEAIGWGARWLAARSSRDAAGVTWPTVVRPTGDPGEYVPGYRARSAWCYGAPGVAASLWLAGCALGDNEWRRLAVTAIAAVCRRPARDRGLSGPGLCHGSAGLLLILGRFATATGKPALGREAGALLTSLLSDFDAGSLLGYREVETTGATVDNPGLLDGAAGVALALLSVAEEQSSDWTRLFLIG